MKLVKQTEEYTIFQRRDERYAVKDASGKHLNGDDKVRILVEEDLIKAAVPAEKPAEEEVVEEAAAAGEEAEAEAPAEDAEAEEAAEEAPAEDAEEDK